MHTKNSAQVLFGVKEHRGLDENALSKICMKKEQSVLLWMSKNIPGETLHRSKYICLRDNLPRPPDRPSGEALDGDFGLW